MFRFAKLVGCVFCVIALLSMPILHAKEQKVFPAAPPPAQIADAKKVFISNGGVELGWISGGDNRPYNQFYAAMKDWGRYELVGAPADADLILNIRVKSGQQLRLVILDPKTHVVLWTFNEFSYQGDKQFNEAMDRLVTSMKQLVEPGPSASTKPKPSRPKPGDMIPIPKL